MATFTVVDTPGLVEASAFKDGLVIAQVNNIVDDASDLPRVDIPGDWIDFIVEADQPFYMEPLFTRDPRLIKDTHILMAIKGIYAKHNVQSLNHGIGFNIAAMIDQRGVKLAIELAPGSVLISLCKASMQDTYCTSLETTSLENSKALYQRTLATHR